MKRPNKESSILAIPNCYSLPFQLVSIYPSPWSYQLSVFLFSSFWLFFSFARPTVVAAAFLFIVISVVPGCLEQQGMPKRGCNSCCIILYYIAGINVSVCCCHMENSTRALSSHSEKSAYIDKDFVVVDIVFITRFLKSLIKVPKSMQ